ncbi:MAG: hypothetical protein HY925_00070 [Elusimicrobia bacterium]|nr:hypothetical protein [Elusimicrobiota bacterium]
MKRLLSLIAVSALALSLASRVDAGNALLQGSGDIQVQNTNVEPPTCSIHCESQDPRGLPEGYCNGREAYVSGLPSGNIRVMWGSANGTSITLDRGDGAGAQPVGASGNEVHYMGQSSWRPFTFTVSNEAGSCTGTVYGRTSCFLKGTKILMEDGTYKNIEDIKAGEVVMGYDTETGTFKKTTVTEPVKSSSSRWYLLNDNLKVSVGHQIMSNGSWTWSENLKVGDKMFDAGGNEVTITSIVQHDEVVDVYNLITAPYHDFFAGTEKQSFLVHNTDSIKDHKDHGMLRGTEILLVDGRRVKVEDLKVGDKIMNYDFKTKTYRPGKVDQVGASKASGWIEINGNLRVAKNHPLYSVKKEKWDKKVADPKRQ